jgi:hypothetical protein
MGQRAESMEHGAWRKEKEKEKEKEDRRPEKGKSVAQSIVEVLFSFMI